MTVFFVIATLIALWLLFSVVASLGKMMMSLATIATCYMVWLNGQDEYKEDAEAIASTLNDMEGGS